MHLIVAIPVVRDDGVEAHRAEVAKRPEQHSEQGAFADQPRRDLLKNTHNDRQVIAVTFAALLVFGVPLAIALELTVNWVRSIGRNW